MESSMLVSIIIPVFNVRPYLAEALDSVLLQTYTHLEIIIIDDGSMDGCGEICDAYARKDRRVHVIHQQNKGLSGARNTGLDRMNGEAVAFLDSDDAYHPDFVKTMLSAMIHKHADLVACKYTSHRTDGKLKPKGGKRAGGRHDFGRIEALRALAIGELDHHAWDKLYSKKLWEQIRYPLGHVYEDIDTTYRIIERCEKICLLKQPLYMHRKRAGSIATTCSRRNIDDSILANRHFTAFVSRNISDVFTEDHLLRSRLAWMNRMIGYYARLSGEEKDYKAHLRSQILEMGKEIKLEDSSFLQKIAFRIIQYCPWLVKYLYSVYRTVCRPSWK